MGIIPLSIFLLAISIVAGMSGDASTSAVAPTNASAGIGEPDIWKSQRNFADPTIQDMVDSMSKGAISNGIACGISFAATSKKGLPTFYVYLINTTTNCLNGFIRLPFEGSAEIALTDDKGMSVEKTEAGRRVGWTSKEIEDYYAKLRENRAKFRTVSGAIANPLFPLWVEQWSGGISIPELFQLKAAGDYTLHLRMRIAQNRLDEAGKIVFHVDWLPEVVANVHIRPESIAPSGVPAMDKTNSSIRTKGL